VNPSAAVASRAPSGDRSFVADGEPWRIGRWLVGVGVVTTLLSVELHREAA
jgi:hypothetical protein